MSNYSKFIVYADESGDHGIVGIDPNYPIFVLIFCVMRKEEYVNSVVPAMQEFKFNIWGHDSTILHEHDIRKASGAFNVLRSNRSLRTRFYNDLNTLIDAMPMTIFASVIDKEKNNAKFAEPNNPYEIALYFCMEQLHMMLTAEKQQGKTIHVVFESRGRKEDAELELEFRRIAGNDRRIGTNFPDFNIFDFQPVFVPKSANSTGLQLADLVARPIGLSRMRPELRNRAFEIINHKIGEIKFFP